MVSAQEDLLGATSAGLRYLNLEGRLGIWPLEGDTGWDSISRHVVSVPRWEESTASRVRYVV